MALVAAKTSFLVARAQYESGDRYRFDSSLISGAQIIVSTLQFDAHLTCEAVHLIYANATVKQNTAVQCARTLSPPAVFKTFLFLFFCCTLLSGGKT